jgi:hypothetical protein
MFTEKSVQHKKSRSIDSLCDIIQSAVDKMQHVRFSTKNFFFLYIDFAAVQSLQIKKSRRLSCACCSMEYQADYQSELIRSKTVVRMEFGFSLAC